MKKWYFAAVFAVLAVFLAGIGISNGSLLWFIDLPSMAVVLLPAFFLSWGVFGLPEIGRAFSIGFHGQQAEADLRKSLAFFDALQWYWILSGLLGTLLGVMSMIRYVDDVKAIGQGMALALLTLWYALVLIMVLVVPFRAGIRRRLAEAGKAG